MQIDRKPNNKMKKIFLLAFTAIMTAVNVNAQTVEPTSSATEVIRQRNCRVGTPNPHFVPRRAMSYDNGKSPYVGNRRQLVVLASFQDRDFTEDHDAALTKWNNIFNAENYTDGMYVGSVHDYFLAQSYGQFNLTFDLMFVELPDVCHKYRSTNYDDEFSQYMVDDIVDALQTQDIDWSLYDWDGDSFVNQLLIIYAGEGMNATNESITIWPHQWWLSQHQNLETADRTDYRSYRTVTRDDKEYFIDSYCCVQEKVDYANLKTSFGTICHEYSHCFGFPDFYYNSGTKVVDEWDIMDYGIYSEQGFRPCSYSAHERMLMGWLTPVELTDSAFITDMPALSDEPIAYLIRNDGAENEYYIVENRQQRGWDESLPGSGIIVFHVDYDKDIWEKPGGYPNSASLKRYTIFPANNLPRKSFAEWPYPYIEVDSQGNNVIANDKLTNTSAPAATLNNANVDGKKLMSKPLTQMSVDANGLASFVYRDSIATSIHQIVINEAEMQGERNGIDNGWYLLDGRRLNVKPTTRGLYIYQGKKLSLP